MAQGLPASATLQVSTAPVVTGSSRVPEHPVHPVSSLQGTEVVVDPIHSGEVPGGGVAVPSSRIPTSNVSGHAGEFPAGEAAVQFQVGQVLVLEVRLGKFQLEMFQFPG